MLLFADKVVVTLINTIQLIQHTFSLKSQLKKKAIRLGGWLLFF